MKINKIPLTIIRALIFSLSLLLIFTVALTAIAEENTVNPAEIPINKLISFNTGLENGTVTDWINGALTDTPHLNEWYAIAIAKGYPEADLSPYAEALTEYLANNQVYSATTKQKYGLALIACGVTDSPYLANLVDETTGKQGVMSYVFALHLLTNGAPSEKYTPENLIPVLLDLACEDGGWSLTGKNADTDVTAMTIQALAPYYNGYSEVKTAVDAAILRLSAMQKDSGGFISYGVENPESAAQVIIALRSVGRDPTTDTAFIKNGNNPFTAMLKYALPNGSYSHTAEGEYNLSATSQSFMALIDISIPSTNSTPFFVFGEAPSDFPALDFTLTETKNDDKSTGTEENTVPTDNSTNDTSKKIGYKLPVCIVILVAAAAVCLVLYLKKNRAIGNYMIVGVAALGICAAVLFTNFTSVDDYYGGEIIKDAPIGSVTVEIKCDTALIDGENAVILDKTAIQIEEGETVYDILMQVTRANSVTVDTVGGDAASSCYVRGIGGIYEFDHGDLSGWTFTVNGEKISTSCDKTKLSDGDTVVWYYSEALYE